MLKYDVFGLLYTRTCPLECADCITESSPKARGRLTPSQVRRYLPAIARFSPVLCFTGGEPLLFHREIVELTAEARALGLRVGLVSGAGWVKDEAGARAKVRELAAAGLTDLTISWDDYHAEFAPRSRAETLARAGVEAGLTVSVRQVLAATNASEPRREGFEGLPISFEWFRPIRLGRAARLPPEHFQFAVEPPPGRCDVVLKPVLEPGGEVYACCGPGHFASASSPLRLGNAEEEPLEDILERAVRDPVLQAIYYLGPYGLYRLLQGHATGREGFEARPAYSGICELCLDINNRPDLVAAVRERLQDRDARLHIAATQAFEEKRGRPLAQPFREPPRVPVAAPGPMSEEA
jgi:MoaA/NifB/PqqE/SkfB family radical SAM enzyme